jgi:hypothetical protein
MLAQLSKRSIGQMSRFHKAPPVILNPWIEREHNLTYNAPVTYRPVPITTRPVPVIARLDRAI